jgi:hypothetical protein
VSIRSVQHPSSVGRPCHRSNADPQMFKQRASPRSSTTLSTASAKPGHPANKDSAFPRTMMLLAASAPSTENRLGDVETDSPDCYRRSEVITPRSARATPPDCASQASDRCYGRGP